jgi:hypothetical protein
LVLEVKNAVESIAFQSKDVKSGHKLTEKELDKIFDESLSEIPVKKMVPKKDSSQRKSLDNILKLAANVLKNSEDVDDFEAKKLAYSNTLLSSISFLMLYRDALINYFVKYKKKPDNLPKNIDFHIFIKVMPLFHQIILYEWLGTQKLRPVITSKMDSDKLNLTISSYERALSIFMYSDIKGVDYPQKIEKFVKTTEYKYLKDMSFLKLLSYFHLRNNTKELDDYYLKLIAEIKEDLGGIHKTKKDQFKKELQNKKSKPS